MLQQQLHQTVAKTEEHDVVCLEKARLAPDSLEKSKEPEEAVCKSEAICS